jgi:glycerol-1-phosphate dehydrogenase [NAD(P)+]
MRLDGQIIATAVAASASIAEVLVARGAVAQAGALYRRRFGTGPAMIIADENTWAAAGQAVAGALEAAAIKVRAHVLPRQPRPKPTVALADDLRGLLAQGQATPVAVGSGVLNDVVKHAAFHLDRPYLCVATAASMDGYTSAGSPLSDHGFKKTIQCRPPRAVLGDLDVICAAPPAMNGWGYGDLAGKVPAGGDWIIADALGIDAIDQIAWPMVQDGLMGWLSQPAAIRAGDTAAIEGLFSGLTLVGLAMEAHGSSRPASGADHQIAHLWEMEDLTGADGERVSHGACVAVGCVAALGLFDWILDQRVAGLDIEAVLARAPDMAAKAAAVEAAFGAGEIAERALEETRAKHLTPVQHRARLELLVDEWPALAARLRGTLVRAPVMQGWLAAAGAPSRAAEIGIDNARLARTISAARYLRSRYTVLDLLDETGLLPRAIAATVPQ